MKSNWYDLVPIPISCLGWGRQSLIVPPTMYMLPSSCFSRVRLCATPWTAAYQDSPSMGFSRQEHWSGLPFPSPMHDSGKWKWSHSVVSDSVWPHGLQPTRLLHPWDFPGKNTGVGCHCLLPTMYIVGKKCKTGMRCYYSNRFSRCQEARTSSNVYHNF